MWTLLSVQVVDWFVGLVAVVVTSAATVAILSQCDGNQSEWMIRRENLRR